MFIGYREQGETLEPQIFHANQSREFELKEIVGCPEDKNLCEYMTTNKTESAWRIASSDKSIDYPQYFIDAIKFIRKL